MGRALFVLFVIISGLGPGQLLSQEFSVYLWNAPGPHPEDIRFHLRKTEIPISHLASINGLPIHIVFVVDVSRHQLGLISLAERYIGSIANAVQSPDVLFTVRLATKERLIIAESSTAGGMAKALGEYDLSQLAQANVTPSLFQGIVQFITEPDSRPVRELVVVSDEDDDIKGRQRKVLANEAARTHTRFFSLLLAQRDFYGTHARPRSGVELNRLTDSSGGDQYWTNWQKRGSDKTALDALSRRLTNGTLVTFEIPQETPLKVGLHCLGATRANGKRESSSHFLVAH